VRITIIGTGYVGLTSAAALAEFGHDITCFDKDHDKILRLRNGDPVIYEDGLAELMQKNSRKLFFTYSKNEAYGNADVVFVCVGTPESEDGSADLSYVYDAVNDVLETIDKDIVLVIKSTVPIGTGDMIQCYIDRSACSYKIDVVSNPEFLSQGTAVKNMLNADRVIIGIATEEARRIMGEIYQNIDSPIVFTDRNSAEMIKYASNTYLALKISYINEIANLCEKLDANINDVSMGMGLDPRIGSRFLNAGIGYGGSCFPKDTKALCMLADSKGYELKTVKATIEVNDKQKYRLIDKARKYYESFDGLTVAVLGLTFKPGTDDLREAPAVKNIPLILSEGGFVKVWDPAGLRKYKDLLSANNGIDQDKIMICTSPHETLQNADVCLVFTEWEDIRNLGEGDFEVMRNKVVLDGRNCLKLQNKAEDLIYEAIGC